MFTTKELMGIKEYIKRKRRDILKSNEGSDLDYIRDLQTLTQLENAVDIEMDADREMIGNDSFFIDNIGNK